MNLDTLRLSPISLYPTDDGDASDSSGLVELVTGATRDLYSRAGFQPPWLGYLAFCEGITVGTCGFKGPPADNQIEIAYFTFPEFEGQGIATRMAAALVAIAKAETPEIRITAQTLPSRNASHRILEKSGFRQLGSLETSDDGTVLEWLVVTPDPERLTQ